jgi:hypothetical protein
MPMTRPTTSERRSGLALKNAHNTLHCMRTTRSCLCRPTPTLRARPSTHLSSSPAVMVVPPQGADLSPDPQIGWPPPGGVEISPGPVGCRAADLLPPSSLPARPCCARPLCPVPRILTAPHSPLPPGPQHPDDLRGPPHPGPGPAPRRPRPAAAAAAGPAAAGPRAPLEPAPPPAVARLCFGAAAGAGRLPREGAASRPEPARAGPGPRRAHSAGPDGARGVDPPAVGNQKVRRGRDQGTRVLQVAGAAACVEGSRSFDWWQCVSCPPHPRAAPSTRRACCWRTAS